MNPEHTQKSIHGYVYLVTNTVNGKVYVGQTITTVQDRWKQHLLAAKNGPDFSIYRAIRKHGADKFVVETLATCLDQTSLDKTEDLYILISRSLRRDKGYNLKRGGRSGALSEETRQKMSKSHTGKICSGSHIQSMRDAYTEGRRSYPDMTGANNPFYGRKHSPETIAKMRARRFSEEHRKNIGLAHAGEKAGLYRHDVRNEVLVGLYLAGIGSYTIAKLVKMDSAAVCARLNKEGVMRVSRGK